MRLGDKVVKHLFEGSICEISLETEVEGAYIIVKQLDNKLVLHKDDIEKLLVVLKQMSEE